MKAPCSDFLADDRRLAQEILRGEHDEKILADPDWPMETPRSCLTEAQIRLFARDVPNFPSFEEVMG